MGRRFTRIPQDTFDDLQVETGVLLTNFDPETGEFADADILTATTGGITVNVKPSITDYGEDVDNCPNKTKELMMVDDYDVNVSTTAVNINKANLKYYLTAADEDQNGKITVRKGMLKATDFKDIWYVGDKSDGGFVACRIKNALSTDGLSLKTGKKAKGNNSLTLAGHYSIDNPDEVPVEFYIGETIENAINLSKSAIEMVEGDTVVVGVSCYPSTLADDLTATVTGTGTATAELTSDNKNVIITATGDGAAVLTVTSGTTSATCDLTITAEGEG